MNDNVIIININIVIFRFMFLYRLHTINNCTKSLH